MGGAAGDGVAGACEDVGGSQKVVCDGGAQHPGAVGRETPGRDVGERSVDQLREHDLHDRVAAGEVGLGGGQVGVGKERVIRPDGNRASG
jgi:hypothetical protein